MNTLAKNHIQLKSKEVVKLINAYNTIGEFLETLLDRRLLYKKDFLSGLDLALKETSKGRVKAVNNFSNLISYVKVNFLI